jgi:hypothetical protein
VGAPTNDSNAATKGYVGSLVPAPRVPLDYFMRANARSLATVSIIQSKFAIFPTGG